MTEHALAEQTPRNEWHLEFVSTAQMAVDAQAALFLGLSRMTGRMVSEDSASRRADGKATHAGVADGTPDLTFYRALGAAPAPGGRRATAQPPDPALHPAPGDVIAPGGVYVVQVLATRDEAQARRIRDRLAAKGFPASISEDSGQTSCASRLRAMTMRRIVCAETSF